MLALFSKIFVELFRKVTILLGIGILNTSGDGNLRDGRNKLFVARQLAVHSFI